MESSPIIFNKLNNQIRGQNLTKEASILKGLFDETFCHCSRHKRMSSYTQNGRDQPLLFHFFFCQFEAFISLLVSKLCVWSQSWRVTYISKGCALFIRKETSKETGTTKGCSHVETQKRMLQLLVKDKNCLSASLCL